jgi:Ca-activated chloride channel family protein
MNGFGFLHPTYFLLIILYWVCAKYCKQKSSALYFSNLKLLKKTSKKYIISLKILKFLIFFFMVLALASPIKEEKILFDKNRGYEISLILDASGSMIEANKFQVVKKIVKDFINKRVNDKIALSIFADFAYVAVPLTYDKKSILHLLDLLDVGVAGNRRTALYEALYLGANIFKNSSSKNKIAILLTDGVNNVDSIPLDVAIKRVQKYNIKVYTIGIGQIGDFNPQVLKQIAIESGGKYFFASSKQELENIYKEIDKLEKSQIDIKKYVTYQYFYIYPLDIAIGLLFIYMLYYRRFG